MRVGVEATRLAAHRSGTEGASGLSSPKRYLWDEEAQRDSWRVNTKDLKPGESPFATDVAFTTFINDLGEPLHRVKPAALEQYPDKGILAIPDEDRKLIFQGVQRIAGFDYGEVWAPGETRTSRIVLIGKRLPEARLREAFRGAADAAGGDCRADRRV